MKNDSELFVKTSRKDDMFEKELEYDLDENHNPRVTAFWNDLMDGSPSALDEPSTPTDMNLEEEFVSIPKKNLNDSLCHSKRKISYINSNQSIVEDL